MAVGHNQMLADFGYQSAESPSNLIITTRPPLLFFFLLFIIVPFLIGLAFIGNAEILILLLPILALPFINDSWKFPSKISFDSENRLLTLTRPLLLKIQVPYNEIKDVSVSVTTLSAGTSPFEEGNKDIIYRVYLEIGEDRVMRLLKLKSRKDIAEDIKTLTDYIHKKISPSDIN